MFKFPFIMVLIMLVCAVLMAIPEKWYKKSRWKWNMIGTWIFVFSFGLLALYGGYMLFVAIYKLCTVGIIYYF